MVRFLILAALIACSLGAVPRLRQRRPQLDGRIVGGEDADISDFPYQLSFEYFEGHVCGASIYNEHYVVTAGHCVENVDIEAVRFRAGSSIMESGGTLHEALRIIQHPDYDWYTLDFDVAVIKVKTPFKFGDGVQPIALTDSEPEPGVTATVTGWGTTRQGGQLSKQLQKVDIPIISHQECYKDYAEYQDDITDNMICAAEEEGGKDSCQGDSGGPLTVDGKLVGIVSWGAGCAQAGFPGVYSNVAALKDFIVSNTTDSN